MTTYVMTGATSGIGAHALTHLAAAPDARILIGARRTDVPLPSRVEALHLDLASLDSVRAFAAAVRATLRDTPVDRLVLNAGINSSGGRRVSADGFDLTFATNHLAHYLLLRLLLDDVAPGGRIVLTTSDTHDPKVVGVGPTALDVDGWATGRATRWTYPASKLGNLMTARHLAELPAASDRGIIPIAYNPGLTGGTEFNRSASGPARVMMSVLRPVLGVVSRVKPAFYVNTPENAGRWLAELADGTITPPPGRTYASVVRGQLTYPDPSDLARDPAAVDTMWSRSAELVGLGG